MASEYDTDSKAVEVSGSGYTRVGADVGPSGQIVHSFTFKGYDIGADKIQCFCLAVGYTKEQCKNKECNCAWCAPLATWFFCDELVIREEPG